MTRREWSWPKTKKEHLNANERRRKNRGELSRKGKNERAKHNWGEEGPEVGDSKWGFTGNPRWFLYGRGVTTSLLCDWKQKEILRKKGERRILVILLKEGKEKFRLPTENLPGSHKHN